jgi:hypothetical protein
MKRFLFVTSFIIASATGAMAQKLAAAEVKELVNNKTYVFEAETARPTAGGTRHLTPGYTLKVNGDSLNADLPYYGKSYTAPMNPSDVGIKVTSTDFDYSVADGKKNSYEVFIKPKDKVYNSEFNLTVYDNGTAYLQVTSPDRQSISFNGYIKAVK